MAKILWFDDENELYFKAIIEFLQVFHNHIVEIVSTLKEAENKLSTEKYDILILDIRIDPKKRQGMKEYDDKDWSRTGVRLIERIREGKIGDTMSLKIPIIVLTAVGHPQTLEEIKTLGKKNNSFIDVIQKPPRLADIEAVIKKATVS
jgi:CheY-like chemotaxis protein